MINKIEEIIKKTLGKEAKFIVTASDKPEFGHYSTNAAFFVSGNPEELAGKIRNLGAELFQKVEVRGKFINFRLSKKATLEALKETLKFTLRPAQGKKSKTNVEFISANPTGPLTMANGRGGFLGDVLANVLQLAGHKIKREYYINDAGNQVKILGESILATRRKMETKDEYYKGDYVKDLAKKVKGSDPEEVGRKAAAILIKEIQKSVKSVGIKFDVWFSEYKNLHKKKELKNVLEILEKSGAVSKHDGAKWLADHVLVKSDGQPTYFLADLAYHYDKFLKRKFDRAIDIWGADHHGYIDRLKAGVKALGVDPEKLKIIITQLVRLIEGGKEVKMSKRAGEFVTLDELIREVGKDAARFFFLMHSPDTHMDFDLALAKEKSLKNPVYYAQYAYVRCGSILKKAKKNPNTKKLADLATESELILARELIKWPDVIKQTAKDYEVSRIVRYATEISQTLHNFYEKERVMDEKGKLNEARLALISAARTIFGKIFDVLGINKLEKM